MSGARTMIFLILLFFGSWLYTEIIEYFNRAEFVREVNEFMHRGDRFTSEDGERLEREICRIDPNCVVKN